MKGKGQHLYDSLRTNCPIVVNKEIWGREGQLNDYNRRVNDWIVETLLIMTDKRFDDIMEGRICI